MNRRRVFGVATTLVLGTALLPGGAIAQQKTIKDQLTGAWTLLLADGVKDDGTHVALFGPNPAGTLMVSPTGRFALTVTRVNRAPYASNDFQNGSAAENKATASGSLAYFGSYTVDEPGKTINFRLEGSTFPNWEGSTQKRAVTAITDDVLTYNVPATPGFNHSEVVWKRTR